MEKPTQQQSVSEMAKMAILGKTETFTTPSGYYFTIRELNGGDDDIISNKSTSKDLTNLCILISSTVIDTNLPGAIDGKLSVDSARNLLLRDRWFIILMLRIHSYGEIVKLEFDWGKEKGGLKHYEENLTRYIWDYKKPFPHKEDDEGYDFEKIRPYPENAYSKQTLTLSSGKVLQFNFLDGNSELTLMQLPEDQHTRNTEIKARNLSLFDGSDYIKIENFQFFNRKDMAEIHKFFNEMDTAFAGLTELQNPISKETVYMTIMQSNDFFYPGEI